MFKCFILILMFVLAPISTNHGATATTNIKLTQEERELLSNGEIILREVPDNGNKRAKTFEAVGLIRATVEEVYKVLIAFEDYPKFMPNVSNCEILQRTNDSAIVNYTLGLPLGKIKKYRLSMTFENQETIALLKWKMIGWPGLKKNETIEDTTGYWVLKDYAEKEGHIVALYHVHTDPGRIPRGLGWIVEILTKNSIPDALINTRSHVYETHKNLK